jgi:hypothetical protein
VQTITDEFMREMLPKSKTYTVVILRKTAKRSAADADKVVWEHGRRNFALRAEGKLAIVCPVNDGSEVSGVSIFTTPVEETRAIMEKDPGVQAGIFTYELHPAFSFPGDSLPG